MTDTIIAVGPPYFADERHALYAGWIVGIAMSNGIEVEVLADPEGNYTGEIRLGLPRLLNGITQGRDTVTLSVPYPPQDWTFR